MEKSGTKTLADLTKGVLEHLYLTELLTEKQIAEKFGTTQGTVGRRRRKWGIPALGRTGRITRELPDLTERQRELIVGSLLGDGWMNAPGRRSARFSEGHSLKQRGYTDWKAELLGPYVSNRYEGTKKDKDTGKVYKTWCFSTRATTRLRPFYDLFYETGERVFPSKLPELLTPFSLAVWYMDDGSIANQFHPRICFGLDELSRKRAFRALRRLGLKPTLHEAGSTISIEFPGQTDEFFALVEPHVPECMAYKVSRESVRREQDRNAKKLTPEKARELYDGEMSLSDIARLYGVGRSTVHRRVHTDGAPKRMGRPRRSYSLRAADEVLSNYDPKEYATLSEDDKEGWVEEAFEILRLAPFPAPPPWSPDRARIDLEKLRLLETREDEDGVIWPQSWRGTQCCGSFFPHRYRTSWRGTRSAYELWHLDDNLKSAIRFQLEHGDPVRPHRVLRAVTMRCRTPAVFRPVVAKHLYSTLCPAGGRVWDPCAGWGGRLMGAAAAGVAYVGTDVEPETVEGNRGLAEALGHDQVEVVLHEAQTFDVPPVDLVFTSPPYFDVEHYGTSDGQSFRAFDSFDTWLDGFLGPLVERAWGALESGGVLALNVAQIQTRSDVLDLPGEASRISKNRGFKHERTLWMPLARLNRSPEKAREPILVFRRP